MARRKLSDRTKAILAGIAAVLVAAAMIVGSQITGGGS